MDSVYLTLLVMSYTVQHDKTQACELHRRIALRWLLYIKNFRLMSRQIMGASLALE